MPKVRIAECAECGRETETVKVNGKSICFMCMEPAYQVLAANESRKLSARRAS